MKLITTCPCCSTPMLHHFRHHREYWFCRKCWQEMPALANLEEKDTFAQNQVVNLSANLVTKREMITI